jgi:transposase-like protein
MAQPAPIGEKPGVTFQPPCPTCGNPMWLLRLSPFDDDRDLRTFKCQVCEFTETLIVQYR